MAKIDIRLATPEQLFEIYELRRQRKRTRRHEWEWDFFSLFNLRGFFGMEPIQVRPFWWLLPRDDEGCVADPELSDSEEEYAEEQVLPSTTSSSREFQDHGYISIREMVKVRRERRGLRRAADNIWWPVWSEPAADLLGLRALFGMETVLWKEDEEGERWDLDCV